MLHNASAAFQYIRDYIAFYYFCVLNIHYLSLYMAFLTCSVTWKSDLYLQFQVNFALWFLHGSGLFKKKKKKKPWQEISKRKEREMCYLGLLIPRLITIFSIKFHSSCEIIISYDYRFK